MMITTLNIMVIPLHQTFRSYFVRSLKASKLFPYPNSIKGCRTLYSKYFLGIDGFLQQGVRIRKEVGSWKENFLTKMKKMADDDDKSKNIYSEDLKRLLAFCQEDQEHIDTFIILMKRFYKRIEEEIRLKPFRFGPGLLRLIHIHELTDLALEVFLDPESQDYVSEDICYQLAMDLLYEKGHYEDVLKLMKLIKSSPKSCTTLASAANYKISTEEALENSLNLLQSLYEAGRRPTFKMIGFNSGLALKLGKPEIALEMCSSSPSVNHFLIMNLRAMAKARLGELQEVLQILEKSILVDLPNDPSLIKPIFVPDVIEEIQRQTDDSLDEEISSKFSHLKNTLHNLNLISSENLDESICAPIMNPFDNERQHNSSRTQGYSNRSQFSRKSHYQSRYSKNQDPSFWRNDNRRSSSFHEE